MFRVCMKLRKTRWLQAGAARGRDFAGGDPRNGGNPVRGG